MLIQVVDHLEKALLEELVAVDLIGLHLQVDHDVSQLINQDFMGLILQGFVMLDTLFPGCIEQKERWHCVWKEPNNCWNGCFGQRNGQEDRVGYEFKDVEDDSGAFVHLEGGELIAFFGSIKVEDPLGVAPEVPATLKEGILGLLPEEL